MKKAVTAALLAMMMAASVQAADKVTTVPVHFAKGAHSAKVDGTFSGYGTINYTLNHFKNINIPVGMISCGTGNDIATLLLGNTSTQQQFETALFS